MLPHRNVQYDGFQWRVNVVRDCIESYVSDEESTRLYAFFNQFADSPRKASSLAQFLSRVGVGFAGGCDVVHPQVQRAQRGPAGADRVGGEGAQRVPAHLHQRRAEHRGAAPRRRATHAHLRLQQVQVGRLRPLSRRYHSKTLGRVTTGEATHR